MKIPQQPRLMKVQLAFRRRIRRAFTLIELLVVIGILTVLIALIFPVVGKLRGMSEQNKCMANLRSLAQSLTIYSADHDGWGPVHLSEPLTTWANELTALGYTPDGQSTPLLPPLGTYVCPSQPNKNLPWGDPEDGVGRKVGQQFTINKGAYWGSTHYGVNNFLVFSHDFPERDLFYSKKKMSLIRHPSRVFLVGDCADSGFGQIPYIGVGHPALILRHGGNRKCNMVFVDGHAEVLDADTVYPLYSWTDNDND